MNSGQTARSRKHSPAFMGILFAAALALGVLCGGRQIYAASTTAYVSSVQATLHKSASNDSSSVTIPYGTEITIVDGDTSDAAWVKVKYNSKTWYIYRDPTDSEENALSTTAPTSSYTKYSTWSGATTYQKKVMKLAWSYLSKSTAYGHNDSTGVATSSGDYVFDCSGFASYILNTVMQDYVSLYDISANLKTLYNTKSIYNSGYTGSFSVTTVCSGTIDEDALEPGDILFFQLEEGGDDTSESSVYNHCGIYLGDGEFIQCTSTWDSVCIMPLSGIYADGFVKAKRYLPTSVKKANKTMYTTSQKTYVYSTNDSSTKRKTTLAAEVAVTLLYTDSGNWSYVKYTTSSGKTGYGYILLKYLSKTDPDASSSTKYVQKNTQKLYTSYSTSSDYITVPINTKLTYYGRYSTSSYYKVDYEGTRYYIYVASGSKISTYLSSSKAKTYKLSSLTITLGYTSTSYSGSAKKPSVTVTTSSGKTLTRGSSGDYTVTYSNNTKIGKATVTITGTGKYYGTVKKTFKITPRKVTVSSLKSKKKTQFTLIVKKPSETVTGYQIKYRLKGTTEWTTVTTTSTATVVKNLSAGTWQVKVRAYKTVSGTNYYGEFGSTKTVKVNE